MKSFRVEPAKSVLSGVARVPGDKSIGHRALMLSALADGESVIRGLSAGVDNQRTRRAMAAMGASFEDSKGELRVSGVGVDGLVAAPAGIDCGNSGTTIRLLSGLLAGQGFDSRMSGDESLSRRPMRRVIDPLAQMGADIGGVAGATAGELYPPLTIRGKVLCGIEYVLPMASAQVKSAVLLAGLYADGATAVVEPGSTRDHTERMLAHMGVPVRVEAGGRVVVEPGSWDRCLRGGELVVPADPSAAAFVLAAALVAGADRVTASSVCINPTRTGFLDVMAAMGAEIEREPSSGDGPEPTADLSISGPAGGLRGTAIAGDLTVRSIDELPILAILAARAEGETDFGDAAELRVKESDRIATTVSMLRTFGVDVEERPDGFTVSGMGGRLFRAGRIDAAGDHRIAMSAAVAALSADGAVEIDDVDNVSTSFPNFVELMTTLGASIA